MANASLTNKSTKYDVLPGTMNNLQGEKGVALDHPRIVRGPYLQQGTESGIIIRWATDAPAHGRMWYGTAPDRLSLTLGETTITCDLFTLPTRAEAGGVASGTAAYYSFDYGNIHFICLDSYESDRSPTGAMFTWLAHDAASSDKDWKVAFWHHPPYT